MSECHELEEKVRVLEQENARLKEELKARELSVIALTAEYKRRIENSVRRHHRLEQDLQDSRMQEAQLRKVVDAVMRWEHQVSKIASARNELRDALAEVLQEALQPSDQDGP